MAVTIRILHLEDDDSIAVWLETALPAAGLYCELFQVDNRSDYVEQLQDGQYDLILSEYRLDGFDGVEALKLASEICPGIPFIFLTGEISEDMAVEMLKHGAQDYILKSNMIRLVSAIRQALNFETQKKQQQQAGQQSDVLKEQISDLIENFPGAVYQFVRNPQGEYRLACASPGFTRLFGIAVDDAMIDIDRVFNCVESPPLPELFQSIEASAQSLQPWQLSFKVLAEDGENRWLNGQSIPRQQEDGSILWNGVLTDVTNEHLLREKLETRLEASTENLSDSNVRMQAVLDNVIDSIITIDSKGIIQSCNPATEDIFGYAASEMIGQNVKMLMPDPYHSEHDQYINNYINTHQPKVLGIGREVTGRRKDGSEFPMSLAVAEMMVQGQLLFTGIVRDITEQKAAEAALRDSEERYRMSQTFANIGTWDWDIQTGELYWSDRIGPLFGYADTLPETTYENFLAAVHPEDTERVVAAVNAAVAGNAVYDIEHRIIALDGQVRWVHERGAVIRDDDGTPLNMLGVVSDIDQRKRLENDLRAQKQLLELTYKGLTHYITSTGFAEASAELLDDLLSITASEYGFIGEIFNDENGARHLNLDAVDCIHWDDEQRHMNLQNMRQSKNCLGFQEIIDDVLKRGEVVFSNMNTSNVTGLSADRCLPPWQSIFCVPVYFDRELVGLYGVANRDNGYDETNLKFLEPLTAAYGVLINAHRNTRKQYQYEQQLLEAKEAAERANRAKSDFLSSMSHELRTPLNAILGFGQLLMMDYDSPLNENQRDSVKEITRAGNHLLELINDVLDLAKIEAGTITLSMEDVYYPEVLNECMALMLPLANENQIRLLASQNSRQDMILRVDRIRLKQVILNLISNAIKYNKPNGSVELDCQMLDDNQYRISVSDTGLGILAEKQHELFKEFHRLGAEASDIEGTGIGLVISHKLVSMMHGRIGLESESGKGSTFWIDIPIAESDSHYLPDTVMEQGAVTEAKQSHEPQEQAFKLLYFEDNPTNLRLIAQTLERFDNLHLNTIHDPQLGLEIARLYKPDLILLNINMPTLDGYQVIDHIRHDRSIRHIPVIAISEEDILSEINNLIDAGFNDCLTKPLDITRFIQTIERHIDQSA